MSKEDQLRKKRAERPIVEEEPIETDKPVERRKKKSLQEYVVSSHVSPSLLLTHSHSQTHGPTRSHPRPRDSPCSLSSTTLSQDLLSFNRRSSSFTNSTSNPFHNGQSPSAYQSSHSLVLTFVGSGEGRYVCCEGHGSGRCD